MYTELKKEIVSSDRIDMLAVSYTHLDVYKRQHNEQTYGTEIRAKYGDEQVDAAHAAVMGLTQAQYQEWSNLGREIQKRLEDAVQAGLSRCV